MAGTIANVEAGQVPHLNGAHGQTELADDGIHLFRRRAFQDAAVGLVAIGAEQAVANEAIAVAADHAYLADAARHAHDRGEHLRRGLRAAHNLQQFHHVRRREEVGAHHILRASSHCRDIVDGKIRSVRSEDGARFGHGIQLREHLLLDGHRLEHSFDDEVGVGEVRKLQRGLQQAHALLHLFSGQLALRGGGFVVAPNNTNAAIERVLLHFEQRHRDAGIEEVHGDAATHGAGTDDAHRLHFARHHGIVDARHLRSGTLGEEHVAQRRRLRVHHAGHERLALEQDAFGKGLGHCRLDEVDNLLVGKQIALGLREARTCRGEEICWQGSGVDGAYAYQGQRRAVGYHFLRERDSTGEQVALHDAVDDASGSRDLGGDGVATQNDLERGGRTNEARQTLRATGARQQTEFHFRQTDLRRGHGHAVVAGERCFEAATERGAMKGRNDGLGGAFHDIQYFGQVRRSHGLAEFGDVRAGHERAAFADEHSSLQFRVGVQGLHAIHQRHTHGGANGIHRRVVDADDADVAVLFETAAHGELRGKGGRRPVTKIVKDKKPESVVCQRAVVVPVGATPYRNGTSSKARSLRECTALPSVRNSSTLAKPIRKCCAMARS